MSSVIEVNDVDISPLFSWSRAFEIVSEDSTTPVYMRLLGDADINRARVASLRRSADLRKKLKDLNSDERVIYIKDIDDLETDSLISVIIVFSMRDISQAASSKLKIKIPKAPRSDAKTEAHEKYQLEIDAYPEKRRSELKGLIEKEITLMKKELDSQDKAVLYKKYVAVMIDELCEQELLKSYKEWCAYLGSYKDESLKQKLFSSFEEFSNLDSRLKDQFMREYSSMELYGDNLKKLQQVTQ